MPAPATSAVLARLRFRGEWRRYQRFALEAFERDVAAGRTRTHLVAPPGSGKTLLGVELVRRLGRPALVLAPNTAIQAQWIRSVELFRGDGDTEPVAGAEPGVPIACLSYQALSQLDDPGAVLGDLAAERWAAERASATGEEPSVVARQAAGWTGEAARRRRRELARITASLKREIARGEHAGAEVLALLAPSARERLEALRRSGVGTVVLDECHHLASLWGYVARAVVAELGGVHVIGLTATPPDELTTDEADLYEELLGPVDFAVPTPAVVRDGHLAPFQELAWLVEPLDSERRWLEDHEARFRDLVTDLHGDAGGGVLDFPEWVITRLRVRGDGDAEVPWASFQRRHPALARAGVRFLSSGGLGLPVGAPRGEGYRQPPDLEDWLVLLEDYAMRGLRSDPSAAAAARLEAIEAALRELGFSLTRRGLRRGRSEVDRLLTSSAAKPIALVEVLACEYEARADRLRAVALVDAEMAGRRADSSLTTVLDPEAGTAPRAVSAAAADFRTAPLRPLLVSGRGLRCTPEHADALLEALAAEGAELDLRGWRTEPGGDGLVGLVAEGPGFTPRAWVPLATRVFTRGATQLLVGTRALLGEGWDAPAVNCLIDMTSAATGVSVRQMRGRSLRLDPQDPEKIASNWDVVCVAPTLARGAADYHRFVRKHSHLLAPCEDGTIEAGASHVHPALSSFHPPEAEEFAVIDRSMVERAAAHEEARRRWEVGSPYRGEEHPTLVVRSLAEAAPAPPTEETEHPPRRPVDQRVPFAAAGGLAAASGLLAAVSGDPVALLGLAAAPAGLAWAAARLRRARDGLPAALPLDLAARAVAEAHVELGELSAAAAASLSLEPRASGYLRCRLIDASPAESARFTAALEEVLAPVATPRYLVSRLVGDPGTGAAALVLRRLLRRPAFALAWHAVPEDLGRRKDRAEAFARAWRRWVGPGELVFTQRSEAGRAVLAEAAAQGSVYEALRRDVWT